MTQMTEWTISRELINGPKQPIMKMQTIILVLLLNPIRHLTTINSTELTVGWGLITQWSKTTSSENANYNAGSSTQSFGASYNYEFN